MNRYRDTLACLLALPAMAGVAPVSVALAASGPSAGDQQYIDPLAGSGSGSGTKSTHHSAAPSGSSSATSGSSSAPSGSSSAATSGSGSSAGPASDSSTSSAGAGTSTGATTSTAGSGSGSLSTAPSPAAGTLPYTGFDGWAGAGVGAVLLSGGLLLRRRAQLR